MSSFTVVLYLYDFRSTNHTLSCFLNTANIKEILIKHLKGKSWFNKQCWNTTGRQVHGYLKFGFQNILYLMLELEEWWWFDVKSELERWASNLMKQKKSVTRQWVGDFTKGAKLASCLQTQSTHGSFIFSSSFVKIIDYQLEWDVKSLPNLTQNYCLEQENPVDYLAWYQ